MNVMNRKGFVPVVVILIILGLATLGGAGYVGINQYIDSRLETERNARPSQASSELREATTTVTVNSTSELDELKKEIQDLKQQQAASAPARETSRANSSQQTTPPPAQIVPTPPAAVVPPTIAQTNQTGCSALQDEYKAFNQNNNIVINSSLSSEAAFTDIITGPAGTHGIDLFVFINNKLIESKANLMKQIDRFDTSVDSLSLSSFGITQLANLKAAYHRWSDSFRSVIDTVAASVSTYANYASQTQIDAATATLDSAISKSLNNDSQLDADFQAYSASIMQASKNEHAKRGCTWITPGTTSPPSVTLSAANGGGTTPWGELTRELTWTSSYADECTATSNEASTSKSWNGPKDISGHQTVSYKVPPGSAVFGITCSNYYGKTTRTVTLYF